MNIMNLRRRDGLPPAVNLDDPSEWPPAVPARSPEEFAPKRQQLEDVDRAVRVITSFGALPTKELDDLLAVAKDELADLEAAAQRVRDAYVEVTDRLTRQIERQRKVNKFASDALRMLGSQCAALDQPELPLDTPAEKSAEEPPAA